MIDNKIEIQLASKKVIRDLPQDWINSWNNEDWYVNVDNEFANYCEKLYNSFKGIKKFYEKEFNANNTYSIDTYIDLFDDTYSKILKVLVNQEKWQNHCKGIVNQDEIRDYARFDVFEYNNSFRNEKLYKYSSNLCIGFSDEAYKKILPYAKQIFILEKMCSFTTRKFWKNEITKIEDLDLKKPFKILVKCIFPYSWRSDCKTKGVSKYCKDRIYSSASLIDERHVNSLFNAPLSNVKAALILKFEDDKFVCACNEDSYSEETINNNNDFLFKKYYSDVMMTDKDVVKGKSHKCFAESVETETPKNIIDNIKAYNEVNIKNPKVVGVFVPNVESYEYAKKEAEKRKVPLFVSDKIVKLYQEEKMNK